MTARVRIDLAAGVLEAEGSEEFIRELYLDFRDRAGAHHVPTSQEPPTFMPPAAAPAASQVEPKAKRATAKTGSTRRERTPVLVKELDLAPKADRIGLKDFVKGFKKPTSSMDWNSLFVYYLARTANVSPITLDHVYTCYKQVGERVPKVLTQSLWDTSRKKGTIDTASLDDLKLTTAGENWVEHDLEKSGGE